MIWYHCASLNGPEWYFITILDNVTQVCVSAPLGWSFWKKKNWSSWGSMAQSISTASAAAWALQKSTINEKRLRQRDPNEATPPSLSLRLSSTSHTTCMLLLLGPAEILITLQRLLAIMTLLSTHTYIYTRTTPLLSHTNQSRWPLVSEIQMWSIIKFGCSCYGKLLFLDKTNT